MAYKHGIYTSEIATVIVPPVNTEAGLPVVIGTAPVHLANDPAAANKPVLCYSYAEAVASFGYCDDWEKYTLCEAIYTEFALYAVSPIVLINVLDVTKHKKEVESKTVTVKKLVATVDAPVILDTLVVAIASSGSDTPTGNSSGVSLASSGSYIPDGTIGSTLTLGKDYEAAYDDDGVLQITLLENGLAKNATALTLSYDEVDASKVTTADIIGGVSTTTGENMGLELVNEVYSRFRLVPGMILAPGWSHDSEVAAVMNAKSTSINGLFTAVSLVDVPTIIEVAASEDEDEEETIATQMKYTDVAEWKNNNNYTGVNQAVCWPMVTLGGKIYHMSTHLMGILGTIDESNDDIPYESPSNKTIQADGLCLADGTEVVLGHDQATYLNGQGVITALNFSGGWKLFGNRTGCYPSNTDPKDAFLCERRMFNWHSQTFIQTYWQKLDKPMTRRLIDTVIDSENVRLNGLAAKGALLGGRVEFLEDENPRTDLIDGIIRFHTYFTPSVPARVIENVLEFDTSYFDTLFA